MVMSDDGYTPSHKNSFTLLNMFEHPPSLPHFLSLFLTSSPSPSLPSSLSSSIPLFLSLTSSCSDDKDELESGLNKTSSSSHRFSGSVRYRVGERRGQFSSSTAGDILH